jgi:hypothetical protein
MIDVDWFYKSNDLDFSQTLFFFHSIFFFYHVFIECLEKEVEYPIN